MENIKALLTDFVTTVTPAIKAGLVHGAKVGCFIAASAAIAAVQAYLASGKAASFDLLTLAIINAVLATAVKAIQSLRDDPAN